jgi:hypothetical protein
VFSFPFLSCFQAVLARIETNFPDVEEDEEGAAKRGRGESLSAVQFSAQTTFEPIQSHSHRRSHSQ